MDKKVYFALCTADAGLAAQLGAQLHRWAEEICLELELVDMPGVPTKADEYAVLLVDDDGAGERAHDALQQLRADGFAGGLVLLTGDDRFAIDGYQCHPDAVVRKPLSADGLRRAVERCFAYWSQGLQWIDLPLQHRRLRVPLYRLYYAEAAGRNTILYRAGEKMQVNCSLSALEQMLPHPPFLRCQKSFVVHLAAVRELAGGKLIMCDGRAISVARGLLRQVQTELAVYRQSNEEEGTR